VWKVRVVRGAHVAVCACGKGSGVAARVVRRGVPKPGCAASAAAREVFLPVESPSFMWQNRSDMKAGLRGGSWRRRPQVNVQNMVHPQKSPVTNPSRREMEQTTVRHVTCFILSR